MRKILLALIAAAALVPGPGQAAEKVRIGFISSLSNPSLAAGPELLEGFKLGLEDAGASDSIELIVNDDQGKPDIGVQLARKMVDENKAQIITGIVPSNIMLAVANAVLPRKIFVISVQAAPSQLAGADCSPYFFATSGQTDSASEAMGLHLNKIGKKRLYLIAANYAAGRDLVSGMKRSYKGEISGETYTPLGQLDYSAELAEARAANPDSVFFFQQAGNAAINFVKQYAEAGLKGKIPLYGVATVIDEETLPGMGDAAVGLQSAGAWGANLDNAANHALVKEFEAKHHRRPSMFTIYAYDGARIIAAALRAVDGHVERADDFRKAMMTVKVDTVRGKFRFNTNQFPIQDAYLLEVKRGANGALLNDVVEKIVADQPDAYVGQCKMK